MSALGTHRGWSAAFVAVAAAAALAGCGGGSSSPKQRTGPSTTTTKTKTPTPAIHHEAVVPGKTLSIYTSFALQGQNLPTNQSVNRAIQLALEQVHGRVDGFKVRLVELDNATVTSHGPDPATVRQDAYQAVNDKTTIAYIGEDASGATTMSIPITNRAGILQVSPLSTSDVLTLGGKTPGTSLADLYPTGRRTFARDIPDDQLQSVAQAQYQSQEGCQKTYIVNDGSVYGTTLAAGVTKTDAGLTVAVTGETTISPTATNFSKLVSAVSGSGANCLFYGGELGPHTPAMWAAIGAALPNLRLFGGDGIAVPAFTDQIGGLPVANNTFLTTPGLSPDAYDDFGQEFYETFESRFGAFPDPQAIFGYELMEAVLASITAAGPAGNNRQAVIDQFFAIRNRVSVLGTYSIDGNGDTTLDAYGGYDLQQGQLTFNRTLRTGNGT